MYGVCELCGEVKYLFDGRNVLMGKQKIMLIPMPYGRICQQCYFSKVAEFFEGFES